MVVVLPLFVAVMSFGAAAAAGQPQPADPHGGAYTRGLGLSCASCHQGDDWARSSRSAFAAAARMQGLMDELNAGALQAPGGITCYTCHRGTSATDRLPPAAAQAAADDWPETATVTKANASKPARDVYRNLQVLGGVRAEKIRTVMSGIVASLGVNCEYCHAGDEWDSDNKPAKRTAREMLRMSADLPVDFDVARVLGAGCYTCHHGQTGVQR